MTKEQSQARLKLLRQHGAQLQATLNTLQAQTQQTRDNLLVTQGQIAECEWQLQEQEKADAAAKAEAASPEGDPGETKSENVTSDG